MSVIIVFGKIKFVDYGEDYKVKFVDYGEDLKVKYVSYGEKNVGKWKSVDYGEDYKIKVVRYGEDLKDLKKMLPLEIYLHKYFNIFRKELIKPNINRSFNLQNRPKN